MKIFKKIATLLLFICLISSCGFVKTITVPKYFKFEKDATFCVLNYSREIEESTITDLNYSLTNAGFNTVSYTNAVYALQYKGKPNINYKNDEIEEILSIKDFNSVYEIRITYKKDIVNGFSKEFKAWVIDMNTNKDVLYYINANDKSLKYILNSFAKKLSKKVNKH